MNWFKRAGFYQRFNALILTLLLLILILVTFLMHASYRAVEDQLEKRGVELASYISALSINDIIVEDRLSLLDRINKAKAHNQDIRYIIIANNTGKVIAHSFERFFPQGLQAGLEQADREEMSQKDQTLVRLYDSSDGPIREIILPVEKGNIGYIRVGLSEKAAEQIIAKGKREFAIMVVLLLLGAVLVGFYLIYLMMRPLKQLTAAAEQIRQGNFAITIPYQGNDEIGRLAAAFNQMADSLTAKQRENDELLAELRDKEEVRAQLLKKLFVVQEEERRHLSRELHDETGQLLASLLAYMKILKSKLTQPLQQELLDKARQLVTDIFEGIRKITSELRPLVMEELGLSVAIQQLADSFTAAHGIPVKVYLQTDEGEFTGEVSLTLYRILQESLTNIAKHTDASRIAVYLQSSRQEISMEVIDDGQGLGMTPSWSRDGKKHLGIYGMKERAELLGGILDIQSQPGEGTCVRVVLPRPPEAAKEGAKEKEAGS